MKVVHIQNLLTQSGNSAYHLHKLLLRKGIDSKIVTLSSDVLTKDISLLSKGHFFNYILRPLIGLRDKILLSFNKAKIKERYGFSTGKYGVDVLSCPFVKEADVIHLHSIDGCFLAFNDLLKLLKLNKKIVWSINNMWPLSGGCYYNLGCNNYKHDCKGGCPAIDSDDNTNLASYLFEKKSEIINKLKIIPLVSSRLMYDKACLSGQFLEKNLRIIPELIDTDVFKRISKEDAKSILNLDIKKKYIAFEVINDFECVKRGFSYFKETLALLDKDSNIELLAFGSTYMDGDENISVKINFLGRIYDDVTLSLIYNAADVFVEPSIDEVFAIKVLESITCGTPTVAFEDFGAQDIIEQGKNGYLVKFGDSQDLINCMKKCLAMSSKVDVNRYHFNNDNVIDDIISIYS